MAPEQFSARKLSSNLDQSSLGIVLYELYVGHVPFRTVDNPPDSESGRAEFWSQILNVQIPGKIREIPEPICSVIKKCLVSDPAKRVKGIEELGMDLQEKGITQNHFLTTMTGP